jgi:hypothetical protein
MFHAPGEGEAPNANGVGPLNNQPACVGCHLNAAEAVKSRGLLLGQGCTTPGSSCTNVSCHARSALDADKFRVYLTQPGHGWRPCPDNLDALNNTGKTAAFMTFRNFTPSLTDNGGGPVGTTLTGSVGCFDPVDGAADSC